MSRSISPLSLSFVITLGSVALFSCETTGTGRAAATSDSAETLSAQYAMLETQIDTTLAALAEIPKNKDGDLQPSFKMFMAEMTRLKNRGKSVVEASADLKANTKKYIAGWEQQMSKVDSADLKEQGETRLAEASAKFEDATDELDRIKDDFAKFYDRLNEIKIVLENDLNPAGVAGLESAIASAGESAGPVREDIKEIRAGLERVGVSLSAKSPSDGK